MPLSLQIYVKSQGKYIRAFYTSVGGAYISPEVAFKNSRQARNFAHQKLPDNGVELTSMLNAIGDMPASSRVKLGSVRDAGPGIDEANSCWTVRTRSNSVKSV